MSIAVDVADLARRATGAAQSWQPGATVTDVRELTGGSSSLTFTGDAVGPDGSVTPLVLKVAPPGLPPVRNRDVLRQATLMHALHGRPGVAVPDVHFEDAGDPPASSPFIAMSYVPGSCYEPVLSEDRASAPPPAQLHARGVDAARMLANLHKLDPGAIGLGDQPVMTLSDEIDRWTRAFTTVAEDLREGYQAGDAALRATMPAMLSPVVTHGDFRLGNTLCVEDRVTSIIDWEIWAVGDPRVDLTWLMYFADDAQHPSSPSFEATGVPTAAELRAVYEKERGGEVPDLDWFTAFTWYKEASATALLVKRARKAGNVPDSLARIAPELPRMIQDAIKLVGG
jgi:aminoglycoside phosphotransferase (APT) family kinase protein